MSRKIIKKINLSILTTIFLSTSSFAFVDNQRIACPAVDLIQKKQHLIDSITTMKDDNNTNEFVVWSLENFKYINHQWHIATFVTSQDFNTAFVSGQNNVKKVIEQKNKYAIDTEQSYICGYTSSNEQIITVAVSFKNFATPFDFKSLKLSASMV